ncbi:MAG: S-methyl-5-thioribose-1-phosphate isomerase [Candidatus Muiribacteriota bacterium]
MEIKAITVNDNRKTVTLIDQRILPVKLEYFECKNSSDIFNSIKEMIVRGAPAIGICALFGAYFSFRESRNIDEFTEKLAYLESARPTAVNLRWAIKKSFEIVNKSKNREKDNILSKLWVNSCQELQKDININQKIGKNGLQVLDGKKEINFLTHCNAGALATGGYGTALGVIRKAYEKFEKIHVFVDETRPYLQGARLTAWELYKEEIPYTLICDNMAGFFMKQKKIDLVVTGADRIALNGDSANKIGTYSLAVLSKFHNIPFYIAAPVSTFDFNIKSGKDIPIEYRSQCEIINIGDIPVTFSECKTENPSFDVTPASLISGIITEHGVLIPPYTEKIIKLKEKNND